ncbi:hypothetical protein PUN28_001372 [Cardiocondyla obscurior]|uniref:Uncharacterized protein n=1 Tax=Cardiocondyla obscurior TaxID=286306 RepID=A0AAW2H4N8_9HYME
MRKWQLSEVHTIDDKSIGISHREYQSTSIDFGRNSNRVSTTTTIERRCTSIKDTEIESTEYRPKKEKALVNRIKTRNFLIYYVLHIFHLFFLTL